MNVAEINENKLVVLLWAWGSEYIVMLEKYGLPSVLAQNLGCHLHFLTYTTEENRPLLESILAKTGKSFEVIPLPPHSTPAGGPQHHFGVSALRGGITRSRSENCRMLWLTGDMVFGRDSIANMMAYAKGKPVTVAAIDIRANYEESLEAFARLDPLLTNHALVSFALKHAHQCTTSAINGTGSFYSGQTITPLTTKGLYSIVYRIPSCYLCYFTQSDEDFWSPARWSEGIGGWDHVWPALLVSEKRFRFMGNSDAAFVLHLTNKAHACSPTGPARFDEAFSRTDLHHDVLGNFVGILREDV